MPMQRKLGFNLSKSRYFTGLRCPKKLYLETHHPELAGDTPERSNILASRGIQIGELARRLFPEGILVESDGKQLNEALERTRQALAQNTPAIFEATFAFDHRLVRVDILERLGENRYHLIEVKSGASLKQDYLEDVAFQYRVVTENGLPVERVTVLCINNEYVYTGGDYDLTQLFKAIDVTEQARNLADDVEQQIADLFTMLQAETPPETATGKHCKNPEPCPFLAYCRRDEPLYPIYELHGVRGNLLKSLTEAGVLDIRDIPEGFRGIRPKHRVARDALLSGKPYFSPGLSKELEKLAYPVHFLDFETAQPALPLFAGTRPYQKVPFQWSLHVLHADGSQTHAEYLHRERSDPQPELTDALVASIAPEGSIVVYNAAFERSILIQLARLFPQHVPALTGMLDRIYDLLPCVEQHCYHPDFRGSYSIKKVLPALVPELGYEDLHIQSGQVAAYAYEALFPPDMSPAERDRLCESLLAYCKRDTEAMVVLYQRLCQLGPTD